MITGEIFITLLTFFSWALFRAAANPPELMSDMGGGTGGGGGAEDGGSGGGGGGGGAGGAGGAGAGGGSWEIPADWTDLWGRPAKGGGAGGAVLGAEETRGRVESPDAGAMDSYQLLEVLACPCCTLLVLL